VKEFLVEFLGQPVLNAIGRMGSCSILTEVVVYVALDSKIPGIEFTFEHLKVIVLIYGFFEEVWSKHVIGRNCHPHQNFLVV
jgi:hypothetical protein